MTSNRIASLFRRNRAWGQTFHEFRRWSFTLATWIPAAIFFNGHVGDVTWISGQSMYPFLNTSYNEDLAQDMCWVSKWNATENLQRGMVVSLWSPNHPGTLAVKRVIALEGDTVFTRAPCPVPMVRIPTNHVWVEGDNRDKNKTLDSNTYGPIPLNLIQGRVTHVLLPWKSSGAIRWWDFKGRTRVIERRKEGAAHWD